MICRNCHEDKALDDFEKTPGGRRRKCKVCVRVDRSAWKRQNKDVVNARERERYAANAEQQRQRSRDYYAANADKRREYYLDNRERLIAEAMQWQNDNRERYRQNLRAHRARSYGVATERYTTEQVWTQSEGRCGVCSKKLVLADYGTRGGWVVDHVRALCLGGSDLLSNTQAACYGCNARKSADEKPAMAGGTQ